MSKENQLLNLTKKMDVPEWKRTNAKWLSENLAKRNANHSDFDKAMKIISEILHEKNLVKKKQ